MSLDHIKIPQLPPEGIELRLPPKNTRELSAEEKYQQVRRHLRDDEEGATMSVQMKAQVEDGKDHEGGLRQAS